MLICQRFTTQARGPEGRGQHIYLRMKSQHVHVGMPVSSGKLHHEVRGRNTRARVQFAKPSLHIKARIAGRDACNNKHPIPRLYRSGMYAGKALGLDLKWWPSTHAVCSKLTCVARKWPHFPEARICFSSNFGHGPCRRPICGRSVHAWVC